jgi:uncharacterized protein
MGAWILGGLLVGWGTRMGNGCTSGHGVCGMPRLAPRSIVAVCTFMATGIAMATFRYYVPFFTEGSSFGQAYTDAWRWISLALIIALNLLNGIVMFKTQSSLQELITNYGLGLLFGDGLVISGMTRITKIMGFLTINSNWDPSLIFVMMSAVAINFFTFNHILKKVPCPLNMPPNTKYAVPPRGTIDARLVFGAGIFGLGWGISGLCPGPGMICLFTLDKALIWVISLAIGQVAFDFALQKY